MKLLSKLSPLYSELYFTINHSKQKRNIWRTHAQGHTLELLIKEASNETVNNNNKDYDNDIHLFIYLK